MTKMNAPYYEQDGITIYHGDCREMFDNISADVMVTDPPYGIAYESGQAGILPRSIAGDEDTSIRDWVMDRWYGRPAIVFGSWRRPRPQGTRALLVWDTKGALGMGAIDLPWKPAHQEIYILGSGFHGRRGTDVLIHAPVQGLASNGRVHPHQKPLTLMLDLISKCPPGVIFDPFCGSGSTLVAAKLDGRKAIGIEIDEQYCIVASGRLSQGVFGYVKE